MVPSAAFIPLRCGVGKKIGDWTRQINVSTVHQYFFFQMAQYTHIFHVFNIYFFETVKAKIKY